MDGIFDDEMEIGIMDEMASDDKVMCGARVLFYKFRASANYDPVLNEPRRHKFAGPWEMRANVTDFSDLPPMMDPEEGTRQEYEVAVLVARSEFERVTAPEPNEGDVFAVFRKWQPKPFYVTVIDCNRDGLTPEGMSHTMYALACKKQEHFEIERIIQP
jgi:hypothetical protein